MTSALAASRAANAVTPQPTVTYFIMPTMPAHIQPDYYLYLLLQGRRPKTRCRNNSDCMVPSSP